MKIALLFAARNFVGPEYFRALCEAGLEPDLVVTVGRFRDDQIHRETARTGGLWQPDPIPETRIEARFDGLADSALWKLLRDRQIDAAVQGGIGILKPEMLNVPRIGFVNVHPGRLPNYRGNSCPEWAVLNGESVFLTAHLIDEGIDTGPVILERPYRVDPDWGYEAFRAGLYPQCGSVMADALAILRDAGDDWPECLTPQNASEGTYRPAISTDELDQVKSKFPTYSARP